VKHFVEIHVPGTNPRRHELLGDRLTLGTGAGASIRVPASTKFEAEQLDVFTNDYGVHVQVPTGTKGALVFDGSEHRSVSGPWGCEVFVGNVRLAFLSDSSGRRSSPVLVLLVPVVLISLGLGAYRAALPNDLSVLEVAAPPLFDEQPIDGCSQSEPGVAEHHARDDERAALAKEERSAFDVTDGMDAVPLFNQALACFQVVDKPEDISRVADELSSWRSRLNEQYATLRLRLRLSLDSERHADALTAANELRALLAHQQEGPYRQWLVQISRTLEHKLSKSGS
jgi:hypothetical protein